MNARIGATAHLVWLAAVLWLAVPIKSTMADSPGMHEDALTCTRPFELQLVRDLDFGRVVVARDRPGQVEVDAEGGYRQLGGAYVSVAPTPAEFVFCGPPNSRFELRVESAFDEVLAASTQTGASRLAPGSVRVIAHGAELRRLNVSIWEGTIGDGGRVSLRFGGRLDIPPRAGLTRTSVRIPVSLRSL